MTKLVRRAVAVVVIVGSAATFAACSSDGDSSSESTCKALQDLAASIRGLTDVSLAQDGTNGLQAAADDVQAAWKQAKQDASDQFGADLDALESSVNDFTDTLSKGRGDASIGDWLSTLGDDISAISDAYEKLSTDAKSELSDCDLSKSST